MFVVLQQRKARMLPQMPGHRMQGFKAHTRSSLTFGWGDGHQLRGEAPP